MSDDTDLTADTAPRRRHSDTLAGMLSDRIEGVSRNLQEHVADCSKLQKRVFLGVAFVAFWIVVHSPEAAKLFAKLIESPIP